MVSIKLQVIFGLVVLCVYGEFFVDGGRFSLGRFGGGRFKLPKQTRVRSPPVRTPIQRTSPMGSQKSLESIAPPSIAPIAETSKKSKIGTAIATEVGKSVALGGTLTVANTLSSLSDSKIRQKTDLETAEMIQQSQQQQQNRATIDCTTNEFGCFKGLCHTNCGPRLDKGDWCYTTKNNTAVPIMTAKCSSNSDCDPCWTCARACTPSVGE